MSLSSLENWEDVDSSRREFLELELEVFFL